MKISNKNVIGIFFLALLGYFVYSTFYTYGMLYAARALVGSVVSTAKYEYLKQLNDQNSIGLAFLNGWPEIEYRYPTCMDCVDYEVAKVQQELQGSVLKFTFVQAPSSLKGKFISFRYSNSEGEFSVKCENTNVEQRFLSSACKFNRVTEGL